MGDDSKSFLTTRAARSAARLARGLAHAAVLLAAFTLTLPAAAVAESIFNDSILYSLWGNASIKLSNSAAAVTQTSDSTWTLDKSGSLSGDTVTWDITATKIATVGGQLLVQGQMTVENTGSGPATIGNIVVNLQTRVGNKWATVSSDVANATDGDDATTADIHEAASSEGLGTFSENGASGTLQFMDATNNTMFSLVPQVLIGSGELRTLLFQAAFDNNVLDLAVGTSIRAEVIVSFGNATQGGNSTANVDINGNGTIDGDEARVRSVPARLGVKVPAAVNGNATVTLSDTLADIATTGTVSFSNAQFNLGATSGTVTATVDGGTDGGTITNCAQLTGASSSATAGGFTFPMINGVDLEDCSTITVGGTPPTCTPGAPGCGWSTGDMVTYSQAAYGDSLTNPAMTALFTNFPTVYGALFEVGVAGTTGFSMTFSSATRLNLYLPAFGTASSLNTDLSNPTTSSSGELGGQVATLKLNVDFNDGDLLGGTANAIYGDLRVCGLTAAGLTGANNQRVRQLLALLNTALGGGSTSGFSHTNLNALAALLNTAFSGGVPNAFAQDHLVAAPSCP